MPSNPEVTILPPSGENAEHGTVLVYPSSVSNSRPLAASQIFVIRSYPEVSTRLPSGDQLTAETGAECPFNLTNSRPVEAFQMIGV